MFGLGFLKRVASSRPPFVEVLTQRAGVISEGQWVINNGYLCQLVTCNGRGVTMRVESGTCLYEGKYDKSLKDSVIPAPVDGFRAATAEEVAEYTSR